uniref:Carbonic anhydrase, family 3 n=1 Tax=uncultured bacterium A1Q1_fos_550 TaxID=1256583 RepID=L7VZG4_9BACT|nr:carbonic anhydrase, family 3 [uncultured bacterium A1Q1_fos_550]
MQLSAMEKEANCDQMTLAWSTFCWGSGVCKACSARWRSSIPTILGLVRFPTGRTMALYELDGVAPEVDPSAWIADSAQVMGRVTLAEDVSVWFGTVIRGDTESITIGRGSNIQDGTVMHADIGMPIVLGEHVTVGHKVMLHGCTIGDETLIGIGAVVLNGAKIGRNCLVGAGALVTEGKEFPDGSMILGSPAKAVRTLTPEQMQGLRLSARHYVQNARRFQAGLRKIG